MTLTRNLVRDLLPLYVAGEASPETRQVVEQWLATDPVLAAELAALRDDRPAPPARRNQLLEPERQVIEHTRHLLRLRAWCLSAAMLCTALVVMSFYHWAVGMHFFLHRFAALEYGTMLAAVVFWAMFFRMVRRLRVAGL